MEPRPIERFACRLHFSSLPALLDIAYGKGTPLEARLEFSLELAVEGNIPCRFGLFQIYDPKTIFALSEQFAVDFSGVIGIMDDFPKEYAFGFDGNAGPKLYFLRLQDDPSFGDRIGPAVNRLARHLHIDSSVIALPLDRCYLVGVDTHSRLKLYVRDLDVKFESISLRSRPVFASVFSRDDFLDTTVSHGFVGSQKTTMAAFFEARQGIADKVYEYVRLATGRQEEYRSLLEVFEEGVEIGHVGVSDSRGRETVRLYFSPKGVRT